jgi:hypothetical protein
MLAVSVLPEALIELKTQVYPRNVCANFASEFAFFKPCEY